MEGVASSTLVSSTINNLTLGHQCFYFANVKRIIKGYDKSMKTPFKIRLAAAQDIPKIINIIEDARALSRKLESTQWLAKDGYPNVETFINDIKHQELYVATLNYTVVGVMALSLRGESTYQVIYSGQWLTSTSNYGVMHRLAVKKEYYGQGVSTALMDFAQGFFKQHNKASIRIDTFKKNQPMLRLVEKLGYKYCGIIKLGKYEGEDDLRLAFEKFI
jgi:ribosomal protein S18 acetylase RimI-like enzyme